MAHQVGGRLRLFAEILLDERRAQMYVQLYQRNVANRGEAVNFAGADHQHVARAGFERDAIDRPAATTALDELNLIVRVPVRARSTPWGPVEEIHRGAD